MESLKMFDKATIHCGGDHIHRTDARHESEFTEAQIEELKAAGFATVENAGYNVYYVCLTEKGRKATGLRFGWHSDNPLLQD
jgi:hypothetical protein